MMRRMWINQPSIYDRLHKEHGTNVLAYEHSKLNMVVYYLDGDVISAVVPKMSLSSGWTKKKKE